MEESANINTEVKIGALRKNLLDLTMRNKLLNFKPLAKSIKVVDEIPTEIYQLMVLEDKKMQFMPRKIKTAPKTPSNDDKISGTIQELKEFEKNLDEETEKEELKLKPIDISDKEASLLWKLPLPNKKVARKHRNLLLQTNHEAEELQKRLFYINQQSKSVLEEQGYNILYLALGFLEWTESNEPDIKRKAPLILIPVALERKKVKGSFKLKWTGEDIIPNISLQEKLLEQGIELPDFEMPEQKEGIYHYFESVVEAIEPKKSWNVVYEIYLNFFSFTKFVMFKDLDPESWAGESISENSIIKALFDNVEENETEFHEEDVDIKLKVNEVFNVVDADSSQIAVIEEAKNGKNMVVEGPPGTGKSQTIVNLISELIANDKTVLFVSEKMAALEVVKNRLDIIGLGEFCLELHSHKSNKKNVLKELERSLYSQHEQLRSLDEEFDELEKLKLELNQYNNVLHTSIGNSGFSPFQLFGMKEEAIQHFKKVKRNIPRANIKNPEKYTQKEWKNAVSTLKNVSEVITPLKPISKNAWYNTEPGTILPTDSEDITELLEKAVLTLNDIEADLYELVELTGVRKPLNKSEMDNSIKTSILIASPVTTDADVLYNPVWEIGRSSIIKIIDLLVEYDSNRKELEKRFNKGVLNNNIQNLLNDYQETSTKFLKTFRGKYKKSRDKVAKLYRVEVPEDDEIIIQDLETLKSCQELQTKLEELNSEAREVFGDDWKGRNTDLERIKKLAEWVLTIKKLLKTGKITERTFDIIVNEPDTAKINGTIQKLDKDYNAFLRVYKGIKKYIKIDEELVFGNKLRFVKFHEMESKMDNFQKGMPLLQKWSQLIAILSEAPSEIALPVIELIKADKIDLDDIIPCLKANFADDLLRNAFLENYILSNFIGEIHERKINRFIDLDRDVITLNRRRIANRIAYNRPHINSAVSRNSELGILLSEFNRKRGHMPIRKLLSNAGSLVKKIKPCFMMSPLSVAQFIDPKNSHDLRFDVVIFDEASQVKPEDALGAFLRANQAVVMGDTRQLPPTTFFDIILETDENQDYEIASLSDMESILHLCKGRFPTKMLRWHYRSRHESLIALSNQEFYDNNLLIYPSPCHETESLGLKFDYMEDTVYDRGRTSSNRLEARRVVEAAGDHYREYGLSKSLGIGTFNIKQQQAILEEVELYLRQNPVLEKYFSSDLEEHFFVKNLETIQGDERDVIFISVGYGKDINGHLSLNFGPLNREGGERRLNVLITRAREKTVVFSNFRHSEINLSENAPFGLRALKSFLKYSETKMLENLYNSSEAVDTAFEDSLYEFLRAHKFDVHKQVGCAGFRLDLAVVDPLNRGRYLLGIECDGESYHSSPVARDRDRLRHQILEGLGWHIYRVWSTDWYRNRSESEKRLLEAVENAKNIKPIVKLESTPSEDLDETKSLEEYEPSYERKLETPAQSLKVKDLPDEITNLDENITIENINHPEELHATGKDLKYVEDVIPTENIENLKHGNSVVVAEDVNLVKEPEEPFEEEIVQFVEDSEGDEVKNYIVCSELCIPVTGQIHEKSTQDLANVVAQIVDIEGPILITEVIRRIRVSWGLKRAGKRIHDSIMAAINFAEQNGEIIIKDEFIYKKNGAINVRLRSVDPPAKINLICDEEIAKAVKIVIKTQFASPMAEIVKQTSRLFGIKVTRGATAKRIEDIVQQLLDNGDLELQSNGMINFPKIMT
jgi:superfamily I DNA and/or RNA helicase/very-short-patch-repair endonuclease